MLVVYLYIIFCSSLLSETVSLSYEKNKLTRQLITQIAKSHHIPMEWSIQQFKKLKIDLQSIRLIQQPAEELSWQSYKTRVLSSDKLEHARLYLRQYKKVFDQYESTSGIPREIVASIIGIETDFGRQSGRHNALAALTTLAFYYTPRSTFFRDEVRKLLIYGFQHSWDLTTLKASYAGALGIPQFMPSVIQSEAKGHNHSEIDLLHNHGDSIASVYHYLSHRGKWQKRKPVMVRLPEKNALSKLINQDVGERLQVQSQWLKKLKINDQSNFDKKIINHSFSQADCVPKEDILRNEFITHAGCGSGIAMRLVKKNSQNKEAYLIYPNFKSIMSYNVSENYAHAVYTMARELKENPG